MFRRLFGKKRRTDLDVDEVFIDSFQLKNKKLTWEHRLEFLISGRPVRVLTVLMLVVLGIFAGRVFYLDVVRSEEFALRAQDNNIKVVWEQSPRGIVYDQNKTPLVANSSAFDIVAIPAELPRTEAEKQAVRERLTSLLNTPPELINELFNPENRFSFQPIPLRTHLEHDELIRLENAIEEIQGVRIAENFVRNYQQGPVFSHVIGYTGRISEAEHKEKDNEYLLTDTIGRDGIEQQYEDILRGQYGKSVYEVNSQGKEERIINTTDPRPGKNITLFLDAPLQQKITEVMQRTLERKGLRTGAAIAIDPKSGGILALQSFPTYDNNVFSGPLTQSDVDQLFRNQERPLFNRPVSGRYSPGSTIKPFMAVAGLSEGVVDESTTVNVTGPITVGGQDFNDWRLHGVVDLKRALAVSSNIFFYTLGGGHGGREGLGIDRIFDYLSTFNLAGPFGIDLPGERTGLIPTPEWKRENVGESWFIGDTYNTSIGQGFVSVTPLALGMAMTAIINDGVLLQPRMVKTITDQNFENPEFTEVGVLKKDFIPSNILKTVREGMRASVTDGYNKVLQDLPVNVAGKTGTVQTGAGSGQENSFYVTFAPYEDPEIVIVYLIEKGGLGTDSVIPVAKEVWQWYFGEYKPR